MTTVSQILGGSSAGGPFLSDPRDMLRWVTANVDIWYGGSSKWRADDEAADFFSVYDNLGTIVATGTPWVSDTYKTIVDVAGAGFLYDVVGPRAPVTSGPFTGSIRITLDDATYEFTSTAIPAKGRMMVGYMVPEAPNGNEDIDNQMLLGSGNFINPVRRLNIAGLLTIYRANQVLKFLNGLKVEAKMTTPGTTPALGAGVRYRPL